MEKLKDTLTLIQAALRDAEEKLVTQEFVKHFLEKLEALAFDAGNLLDDINYEMIRRKVEIQSQMNRKVCFFFSLSNPIASRCSLMANKTQQINMDLKRIDEEAMNFSLQSHIGARDAPAFSPPSGEGFMKKRETDFITAARNNETLVVLPIVGMGGIGKATLARNVFNDPRSDKHFDKRIRIWVCVSVDFNANRLFDMILVSLQVQKPKVEGREPN